MTDYNTTKEHNCKFYKGKMVDVTVIRRSIYCRRCHKQLTESEVDPATFKKIMSRFEKKTN